MITKDKLKDSVYNTCLHDNIKSLSNVISIIVKIMQKLVDTGLYYAQKRNIAIY